MKQILIFSFFLSTFISLETVHAKGICKNMLQTHVRSVSIKLQTEVRRLESELRRELSETEQAAANVTDINTKIDDLKSKMTWVEKSLWGWLAKLLGGDAEKIDGLRTKKEKKAELKRLLAQDKRQDADADQAVLDQIESYMLTNDRKFSQLKSVESKLGDIVCKGDSCIRKIDDAINQVSSAETMEMFDMVTDNAGISLLSHMDTSDANMAAKEAKEAAEDYVRAVQQLKGELNTISTNITDVDDTIDLVVDIVFDFGFDFLSVFQLFHLSDLGDDLDDMRAQVYNIKKSFDEEHEQVKTDLKNIVCEVRDACK